MSEYTPTTEEIRKAFTTEPRAFDRWLASVKAEAWDEGLKGCSRNSIWNPYREEPK